MFAYELTWTAVKSRERRNAAPDMMHPPRDKRSQRLSAPLLLIVNKFGREGVISAWGPDRPCTVVNIELGHDFGEVNCWRPSRHPRFPTSPPIGPVDRRRILTQEVENWCANRPAILYEVRNHVPLPEIMARIRVVSAFTPQLVEQEFWNQIHRSPCWPMTCRVLPGIGGGSVGFSRKDWNDAIVVHMHDPEAARLRRAASRGKPMVTSGALLDMLLQHAFVVHLVDVDLRREAR